MSRIDGPPSFLDKVGRRVFAKRITDGGPDMADDEPTWMNDLALLLNTRGTLRDSLELFPHLSHSSFAFGMDDFTATGFNSRESAGASIAIAIRKAIESYEPRLQDVFVVPYADRDTLVFEVRAKLRGNAHAADDIVFNTELRAGTGRLEIVGP